MRLAPDSAGQQVRRCPRVAAWVLCFCLASVAGHAEIYRWTDGDGRLHFTERLENVPPQHREAAVRAAMRAPTRGVTNLPSPPEPEVSEVPASRAPAARARSIRGGAIRIPFQREGTLMRVDAEVNDHVTTPFLIDTGASGVSLPSSYAERLGIHVGPETPHIRVMTANGAVMRAVVQLDSIQVGGARVEGLHATVNPAMSVGLLGGSFFNNFVYRVDAAEQVITLEPNEQIRGGMGEDGWRRRFVSVKRPLDDLNTYLEDENVRRKGERALLERRRTELETQLEKLEDEANRLNVPHGWRQ